MASYPRRRPLRTVGISNVFLTSSSEALNPSAGPKTSSFEIIGSIKQNPEDFVVKEISHFRPGQKGTIHCSSIATGNDNDNGNDNCSGSASGRGRGSNDNSNKDDVLYWNYFKVSPSSALPMSIPSTKTSSRAVGSSDDVHCKRIGDENDDDDDNDIFNGKGSDGSRNSHLPSYQVMRLQPEQETLCFPPMRGSGCSMSRDHRRCIATITDTQSIPPPLPAQHKRSKNKIQEKQPSSSIPTSHDPSGDGLDALIAGHFFVDKVPNKSGESNQSRNFDQSPPTQEKEEENVVIVQEYLQRCSKYLTSVARSAATSTMTAVVTSRDLLREIERIQHEGIREIQHKNAASAGPVVVSKNVFGDENGDESLSDHCSKDEKSRGRKNENNRNVDVIRHLRKGDVLWIAPAIDHEVPTTRTNIVHRFSDPVERKGPLSHKKMEENDTAARPARPSCTTDRGTFCRAVKECYPFLQINLATADESRKHEQEYIAQCREIVGGDCGTNHDKKKCKPRTSENKLEDNEDDMELPKKCAIGINFQRQEAVFGIEVDVDNAQSKQDETNSPSHEIGQEWKKDVGDEQNRNLKESRWITIEVDRSFFGLVPFLAHPMQDIMDLYRFRNRGIIDTTNSNNQRWHSRQRKKHGTKTMSDGIDVNAESTLTQAQVALRLRSGLGKLDRRTIHFLISNNCRDFQTSTVTISKDNESTNASSSGSCTCVVISWSRQAHRKMEKRKRNYDQCSTAQKQQQRQQEHTLCVLQKRGVEHLSCVQCLAEVLRCRTSDIGLGGIKDMYAVTCQFVTFRNVSPMRVKSVASSSTRLGPSSGIQLGNFARTECLLNTGDLYRNQFEIILRNVRKRPLERELLKIESSSGICLDQECKACRPSDIEAVVKRIKLHGFINFYGEQRLGDTCGHGILSVRSYDIGRAMLQKNFMGSINLLMQGKGKGGENVQRSDIDEARQIWKESNGDAMATLKACPKNGMTREKLVLKGLKRYGNDEPLKALRCLPYSIRMFWIHSYQSYIWNIVTSERIKRFGAQVVKGDLYVLDGDKKNVKIFTGDKEDQSNIELEQVVLPLPGYDVVYPSNEIGTLYEKLLTKDKIQFQKDNLCEESTARGSYRHLISRAWNLTWETVDSSTCSVQEYCPGGEKKEEVNVVDAVRFKFQLDRGSYATMMLRELMHTVGSL